MKMNLIIAPSKQVLVMRCFDKAKSKGLRCGEIL